MDWRILYNPVALFGKSKGLAAAAVVNLLLLISAWRAWVYLDGAIDLHVGSSISFGTALLEILISWFSLSVFFFLVSKIFGGDTSIRLHTAAAGLGRFPYIIGTIIASHKLSTGAAIRAIASISDGTITIDATKMQSPLVIISIILLMLVTAWSIIVLYFGFKTASRLDGPKAAIAFVLGIIFAEVFSKLVLHIVS